MSANALFVLFQKGDYAIVFVVHRFVVIEVISRGVSDVVDEFWNIVCGKPLSFDYFKKFGFRGSGYVQIISPNVVGVLLIPIRVKPVLYNFFFKRLDFRRVFEIVEHNVIERIWVSQIARKFDVARLYRMTVSVQRIIGQKIVAIRLNSRPISR